MSKKEARCSHWKGFFKLNSKTKEASQETIKLDQEMSKEEERKPSIREGSGVREHHAALTIQRAFRKYRMVKRLKDIANASKGEKCLSRRVYALELENSNNTGSNTTGSGSGVPGVESSVRQKTYCMVDASPVWKRKSLVLAEQCSNSGLAEDKPLSNVSENSEDSLEGTTVAVGYCGSPPNPEIMNYPGHSYGIPGLQTPHDGIPVTPGIKVSEVQRKRQYRVGLNLFNEKPERGIRYLILNGFLDGSAQAVARFLISTKGLSKQMIGEYLGNLMSPFNMDVLKCFVQELDLAGMQVDEALRKFQTYFRLPGEAQKIDRIVEEFSKGFVSCNGDIGNKDTVYILAFAIIMLNTDLHTPNMKAENRMKLEDFIKSTTGAEDCHDLDKEMLTGIYERIKANEFKPGTDHVTLVSRIDQRIVGKKPNLALPHRRFVWSAWRLYEVSDVSKKQRPGVHEREVFIFNDMLMVTKSFSEKEDSLTFRQSFPLCGMCVTLFKTPYYPHGIRLSYYVDGKVLVTFNAPNECVRSTFVRLLKESILEMDDMENLRIEAELEKQQQLVRNLTNNAATSANLNGVTRVGENRDSSVADMEIIPPAKALKEEKLAGSSARLGGSTGNLSIPPASGSNSLKRSALSNPLLDLYEQHKFTQLNSSKFTKNPVVITAFTKNHRNSLEYKQKSQVICSNNGISVKRLWKSPKIIVITKIKEFVQ